VNAVHFSRPQDAAVQEGEMRVRQKVGGALYPDEVAVAAAAFQAALVALGNDIQASSHSVRRTLAEYISAHALNGELDVDELRDGALRFIRTRPVLGQSAPAADRSSRASR
jgi:hypothetical protein